MNKLYPVKQLYSGNLQEICSDNFRAGLKNIIGLIIPFNGQELFYSIFDDCFFRLLPTEDELTNNREKYFNRIFVDIFGRNNSYMRSLGTELYEHLQKDFMTKQEIIENRDLLRGYFSDLDYELLKVDTDVDYENASMILDNIIESRLEYEQKLNRPIMCMDGIRLPCATKKLIKQ